MTAIHIMSHYMKGWREKENQLLFKAAIVAVVVVVVDTQPVWPDLLDNSSMFGHLQHWKFAQSIKTYDKVDSQFCQIQISLQKIADDLKFCQSG